MSLRKRMYELIVVALVLAGGCFVLWYKMTTSARQMNKEYKTLQKIAERQEVEIRIFEQGERLQKLRAKQRGALNAQVVADPKSVPIKE